MGAPDSGTLLTATLLLGTAGIQPGEEVRLGGEEALTALRQGRVDAMIHVGGAPVAFADFIAPGLIVMGMLNNAFANAIFSLLVGKIQGNIVDYLMPPLSTAELIAGLIGASVTRAVLVGCAQAVEHSKRVAFDHDIAGPELPVPPGLGGVRKR